LLFAAASAGCATPGPYVWAKELPPEADTVPTDYAISPGDLINVRVFNQDAMTTRARVRADGKISMPFVGDVLVAGKPPAVAAREIEISLKSFINAPNVTVTVEEFTPATVSVVGEVAKPGTVVIERGATVLTALAAAGGLTENAARDDIYVLRERPTALRIRFTYDSLTQNPPSRTFRLRAGDVIVVE
jgi:polysaccharide export outer membrane protein